jgi:hypothetical protein
MPVLRWLERRSDEPMLENMTDSDRGVALAALLALAARVLTLLETRLARRKRRRRSATT